MVTWLQVIVCDVDYVNEILAYGYALHSTMIRLLLHTPGSTVMHLLSSRIR